MLFTKNSIIFRHLESATDLEALASLVGRVKYLLSRIRILASGGTSSGSGGGEGGNGGGGGGDRSSSGRYSFSS